MGTPVGVAVLVVCVETAVSLEDGIASWSLVAVGEGTCVGVTVSVALAVMEGVAVGVLLGGRVSVGV